MGALSDDDVCLFVCCLQKRIQYIYNFSTTKQISHYEQLIESSFPSSLSVSTTSLGWWCLDGCRPPPYVDNATASFDQLNGSVTVTCIKGHRLPSGLRQVTQYCNADGSWHIIDHCNGLYCIPPTHYCDRALRPGRPCVGERVMCTTIGLLA